MHYSSCDYMPLRYGTDHSKSDGGGRGGGEKNKKKFMQGKMPRKKIHAKKKVKKIHAEGRSNCDFFTRSKKIRAEGFT